MNTSRYGWICPKCERSLSPDVSTCSWCAAQGQAEKKALYPGEKVTSGQMMVDQGGIYHPLTNPHDVDASGAPFNSAIGAA